MSRDPSSPSGAESLAQVIRQFWTAKGYPAPEIRIEHMQAWEHHIPSLSVIRSDMVGGLPRGKA